MTTATTVTRPETRPADRTHDVEVTLPGTGPVGVRVSDRDRTRTYLLLHGGAGPGSVAAFGELLATRTGARVLIPTHPGFDGTERPADLSTTRDLARLHVGLLAELDVHDVTVVGNSLGGWVAAEIALLGDPRVGAAVVVDAVGAHLAGEPVADVRTLAPAELVARSFADPARAAAGTSAPAPDRVRANLSALYTYGGETMSDPTLLERLRGVDLPVRVVWGAADRIVSPAHGRALADAIPSARFDVLDDAGHLPQLETPEALLDLVTGFTR